MSKYSFDFKKKVVMEYLNGEGGWNHLTKKYGLGTNSQLRRWVSAYQQLGDEGLMRSRKNENYSFERKLSVVELYLSSELSYQEVALKEGITNPNLIVNWVNRFRAAGPDALRPRKKGRRKTLDKSSKETIAKSNEETILDTSVERVKELEDELLKLRIENAFLKELRRLRLETKQNERTARIINGAQRQFKLKDLLIYQYAQSNLYVLAKAIR